MVLNMFEIHGDIYSLCNHIVMRGLFMRQLLQLFYLSLCMLAFIYHNYECKCHKQLSYQK